MLTFCSCWVGLHLSFEINWACENFRSFTLSLMKGNFKELIKDSLCKHFYCLMLSSPYFELRKIFGCFLLYNTDRMRSESAMEDFIQKTMELCFFSSVDFFSSLVIVALVSPSFCPPIFAAFTPGKKWLTGLSQWYSLEAIHVMSDAILRVFCHHLKERIFSHWKKDVGIKLDSWEGKGLKHSFPHQSIYFSPWIGRRLEFFNWKTKGNWCRMWQHLRQYRSLIGFHFRSSLTRAPR